MAPPAAAKQVRIAPHPARERRSRLDQMKLPLSASGMPGFPPGIQLPLLQTAEKRGHFLTRTIAGGQGVERPVRQVAARSPAAAAPEVRLCGCVLRLYRS